MKSFSYFIIFLLQFFVLFSQKSSETLAIGDYAPFFALKGIDDKIYSLKSFEDKDILVVAFIANHCPTSQSYVEKMKKLISRYKDKSLAFVAISPSDSEALFPEELRFSAFTDSFEDMKVYAKNEKFNFPYLYDGGSQVVTRLYGAKATPHFFVFDKQRQLRYQGGFGDGLRKKRAITKSYLFFAINSLLKGDFPRVKWARVLGCSVKWSYKRKTVLNKKKKFLNYPVDIQTITQPEISKILANESPNLRLVNFWATWFPPSVKEFSVLSSLLQTYSKRNFDLVTISLDKLEDLKRAKEVLKEYGISIHHKAKKVSVQVGKKTNNFIFLGYDKKFMGSISADWKGDLPYTMLIAPGGKIIYAHQGELNLPLMRKKIFDFYGPRGY